MFYVVYSRHTKQFVWVEATLNEAVDTIRVGEDDGMIFGVAVYDDVGDTLYIAHPDLLSETQARRDVEKVLERSVTNAAIMPFPARVEEG